MSATPGAIYLRFRKKFEHGLRAAYYRDVVRTQILRTSPIADTIDKTCEIHVLTSSRDWLNLIWTLKSFYAVSPKRYALCIHGDVSLPSEAFAVLREHFPAARFIARGEADEKACLILKEFPRCQKFRQSNVLAPKVFDFMAFLEGDRMALFDSDLLFFGEPTAYLRRVEDAAFSKNVFNADIATAYTVLPEVVRDKCGFELLPKINSGFGLIHRDSMRLDWIEEFLGLPGILDGHFWRIEQTLYALCSSRYGVELLPDEYTVDLRPGLRGRPFRHYLGAIRHLFYKEGVRHLHRSGFGTSMRSGVLHQTT